MAEQTGLECLRALREIRVTAEPSWDAEEVRILYWFIRDSDEPERTSQEWNSLCESWLHLAPATGRFIEVSGVVTEMAGMTAQDYVESDPLDLDHMSDWA